MASTALDADFTVEGDRKGEPILYPIVSPSTTTPAAASAPTPQLDDEMLRAAPTLCLACGKPACDCSCPSYGCIRTRCPLTPTEPVAYGVSDDEQEPPPAPTTATPTATAASAQPQMPIWRGHAQYGPRYYNSPLRRKVPSRIESPAEASDGDTAMHPTAASAAAAISTKPEQLNNRDDVPMTKKRRKRRKKELD